MHTYTATELAYLIALLGGDVLLGVPDPFHGWLAFEVEEALAQARASLLRRNLLHIRSNGTVAADAGTAHLVRTCTLPDVSFRIACTPAKAPLRDLFIHMRGGQAVEVTAEEQGALCRLAAVTSVAARVLHWLGIADQSAPAGSSTELKKALLRRALELAEEGRVSAAHELLLQVGVAAETAAALAGTLADYTGSGVLVRLARGSSDAAGVGFLASAGTLWEMRPANRNGEAWVTLRPCGADRATALINQVLQIT